MMQHKFCFKCKETKPRSDFSKNRTTPDGLQTYCRSCKSDLFKLMRQNRPWAYARGLKSNIRKFGISSGQFLEMLERQQGLCAICLKPETKKHPSGTTYRLAVDHCHDTGKIRGLLCSRCNKVLGLLEESFFNITVMENYLLETICKA